MKFYFIFKFYKCKVNTQICNQFSENMIFPHQMTIYQIVCSDSNCISEKNDALVNILNCTTVDFGDFSVNGYETLQQLIDTHQKMIVLYNCFQDQSAIESYKQQKFPLPVFTVLLTGAGFDDTWDCQTRELFQQMKLNFKELDSSSTADQIATVLQLYRKKSEEEAMQIKSQPQQQSPPKKNASPIIEQPSIGWDNVDTQKEADDFDQDQNQNQNENDFDEPSPQRPVPVPKQQEKQISIKPQKSPIKEPVQPLQQIEQPQNKTQKKTKKKSDAKPAPEVQVQQIQQIQVQQVQQQPIQQFEEQVIDDDLNQEFQNALEQQQIERPSANNALVSSNVNVKRPLPKNEELPQAKFKQPQKEEHSIISTELVEQIKSLNKEVTLLQNRNKKLIDAHILKENQLLRKQNEQLLTQIRQIKDIQAKEQISPGTIKPNIPSPPLDHQIQLVKQKQMERRLKISADKESVEFSNYPKPIPKKYICGICLEPLKQPITLQCGHSFCLRCLDLSESEQYKAEGSCDKAYCCPGRVVDPSYQCLSKKCDFLYEEQPGINLVLAKEINDFLKFDEKISKNDYVYLFEDDFGQVMNIEKVAYDFTTQQISEASKNFIFMLTIKTVSNLLIKTEIFNVTKFYPQYIEVSTRVTVFDVITKMQQPQKSNVDETMYLPQVHKFTLIPTYNYCNEDTTIFRIQSVNAGQMTLKSQNDQLKIETAMDDYITLRPFCPLSKAENECCGCKGNAINKISAACGCIYCFCCAVKLARSKIPCMGCQRQIELHVPEPLFHEVTNQASFIDQEFACFSEGEICFITQLLNEEDVIIRKADGTQNLVKKSTLQPINYSKLIRALRPKNGDLCLQQIGGKGEPQYFQFAIVKDGQIISAAKKVSLSSPQGLTKTVRLVNETELMESMCPFCRQLIKRPTMLPCQHTVCRSCAILADIQQLACFQCSSPFHFVDCQLMDDQSVDLGSLCYKRFSKVNSYGSKFGFVRQLMDDTCEVVFSSVAQKVDKYDLLFVQQSQIQMGGEPGQQMVNDLCIISEGNLSGVCCLVQTVEKTGRSKVLTEVGVLLENQSVKPAIVQIKGKK